MVDSVFKLAQISDMHLQDDPNGLQRGVNPEKRFLDVLAKTVEQSPDLLLLTGDLSHHSSAAYERLVCYLSELPFPCLWIPGNHDLVGDMAALASYGFGQKVYETPSWKFILLDSTANPDGKGSGALSEPELDFLQTELAEVSAEQSVLLVLHHNPVSVNSAWQDEIMLSNADQFWSLVDTCEQVKAVLFGHVHQAWEIPRKQVKLFSAPSTAAQFKRCTSQPEPETAPDLSGPGFMLYTLSAQGGVQAKVHRLEVSN